MIEGIHVDVSGQEIHSKALQRQKYHERETQEYEDKAARANAVFQEANVAAGERQTHIGNPANDLRYGANRHRNKAKFFAFLADHIDVNETYRLSEKDLAKLEIIEDRNAED